MLEYVWGGSNNSDVNEAIGRWVSFHTWGTDDNCFLQYASFGVMRHGEPIAGVIYHDHKPMSGTVQYSGAATDPRWLGGPTLHHMFGFMFDDLGCQMAITGNAETNTRLHKQLTRTGHVCHHIDRGWSRDEAMMLWTLTREQWLENPTMQRATAWANQRKEASNVEFA